VAEGGRIDLEVVVDERVRVTRVAVESSGWPSRGPKRSVSKTMPVEHAVAVRG
jgi:hypothetical protein